MDDNTKEVHVFIVSDATGVTAERVITAALLQFKEVKPVYRRFPFVRSTADIEAILTEAVRSEAIIIYSLVSAELRRAFRQGKLQHNIYAFDLLGPLLRRMERLWDLIPAFRPGLLKGLDEESMRLAESIDYTLKHDDGLGIETLKQADLLVLGISRTSKTPTSLYLSCNHNLKVANYPIMPGVDPPEEIFSLDIPKVGFTISPHKAALVRAQRGRKFALEDYTDIESIRQELINSHKIFRKIKNLQIIDVTHNSIEEIADKILSRL
jgi:regulator of PEP synthase PpsR (kinase-PPPase family)